ncbi:flagellar hook assembly protein FlgD [Thiosulfativibrio zosterae]|uniref:Basal-body rod modification protein FlgD n=1 Tax=Thiosulfativibrio zosterae TaxID=2675053 RepID=A0A6F8PLV3_9GAMM|nr:flagellar hook capping FlgD N-terminal domain-containing protein [Thiosulfativibrio zosterae]BBP43066.1 basal-body rod modification protein FlgD [Thiosulfativibrio zosterae]
MATVLPTTGVSASEYATALQQASNPSTSAPSNALGQADFLRLLTTQLANQDPNKPMDPTNFVTDLTQMSQLESTNQMNASVLAMTKGFQSLQTLQGAALIGKSVQAEGEEMSHTQGKETSFRLEPDQPLSDVKVVITNEFGPVKELSLGDLNRGESTQSWDGLDEQGNPMASGQYSLTVYGTDETGELQSIKTIVPSQVKSVGINTDGTMALTLATGERVALDAVREISE